MHLILLNLTAESVACHLSGINNSQKLILGGKTRTNTGLPRSCTEVALSRPDLSNFYPKESEEWSIPLGRVRACLRVPLTLNALWKTVSVPDECPWRIYLSRVSGMACFPTLYNTTFL
jgi:1-phosphatidylinositol phosphodiesterase